MSDEKGTISKNNLCGMFYQYNTCFIYSTLFVYMYVTPLMSKQFMWYELSHPLVHPKWKKETIGG